MAKTSYIELPPGYDVFYKKVLASGDRFYTPRVRFKRTFVSRKRKAVLSQRSMAVTLSPVWQAFTSGERAAWNDAGLASQMSGFKLFVQDTCFRIKNSLTGYSTPSVVFQSRIGKLDFSTGATDTLLAQLHPLTYWVERKVHGTRDQYEDVPITESFDVPITIGISYKANFTGGGGGNFLKFYAEVVSNYQGRDIVTNCEILLSSGAAWQRVTQTLSQVVGVVRGYTLNIQAKGITGKLYFDNVQVTHSGHNWARDPRCNKVDAAFGRRFYQVPRNWVFERHDTGVLLQTVYNYESL